MDRDEVGARLALLKKDREPLPEMGEMKGKVSDFLDSKKRLQHFKGMSERVKTAQAFWDGFEKQAVLKGLGSGINIKHDHGLDAQTLKKLERVADRVGGKNARAVQQLTKLVDRVSGVHKGKVLAGIAAASGAAGLGMGIGKRVSQVGKRGE